MIVFAARMIKVLLLLIFLGISYILFKQKLSRKAMLKIAILTILVAFAINWLVGFLPPLTDKVVLTALGEKQSNAKSSEVFLTGYTIDGKYFTSGKFLKISKGHWFWIAETYAWRPEADQRQPDGVTRTVELNIPVGWSRILSFSGGSHRGYVEINANGNKWVVDTYRESDSKVPIEIGRSKTSVLIINQSRYLLLFLLLLLVYFTSVFSIIYTATHSPKRVRYWLKNNIGKLIYSGIAITTFCLMFIYANKFSLWYDELCQIVFVKNSVSEAFLSCLNLSECSPPLALICSALWYRIAPYGEQWLLLISMILSALSIYIMGLIGEKITNTNCGVLAAIMMAVSTTVWLNAAYEYRAYSYFLFFSTLSLYLFIRKNESNRHLGWAITFSVSLACLAMTHYFGMLVCAIYFLGDLFLWHKRQIKWKEGLLFLLPGVCSACWLLAVAIYRGETFVNYLQWQPVPNISDIRILLMFLTGETEWFYLFLLFAIANCIVCYFQDKENNRQNFKWVVFYQRFFVSEIVITIAFVYIYGAYINRNSTLWSERYFMFLIPVIITIMVMMFRDFSMWIESHVQMNYEQIERTLILFVGLVFSLNTLIFISSSTSQSLASFAGRNTRITSVPLRESADWLYQQSDIFNDTTLIVTSYGNSVKNGWIEYYITQQGRRDVLNIIDQSDLDQDEVLKYNKIYVEGGSVSSWLKTLLDEKYTLTQDNYSALLTRKYIKK